MAATKSSAHARVQRVAKHLYRRGEVYTYRRVIPAYARAAFGGLTEYVRSLGDVGLREAGHLAAQHRAHCDKLIAAAASKPDPTAKAALLRPSARVPDREEIDRAVRMWVLDRERDAETVPVPNNDTGERVQSWGHYADGVARHMRTGQREAPHMTRWIAESIAEAQDWIVPADGDLRRFLEERIARGERELATRRKAELNWDDQPQPTHRMFAPEMFEHDRLVARSPRRGPIPIMEMFDGYKAEREPVARTVKKWRAALSSLIEHLGHDDASRVTTDDIVAWKNVLLAPAADGQRARGQATVRNGYIGAAKPVFGWAVANRLIESNPVAGVSVRVPRRVRTRTERGFTDSEAKIILTAANAIDCQADGSFKAFACRWLPWLCAYTGARISEMAQLRREDVGQNEEGLWFVAITPEAGSTKTGFARKVALHPHLLEQGFVQAISDRRGPLFYDPKRKRAGSDGNPQYGKVGQRVAGWVRSIGVADEEVQPNHGWRHRFITVARDIQMDPDVRQAIVGHSARSEHQDYGNTLIRTSYRALTQFPHYKIGERQTSRCAA